MKAKQFFWILCYVVLIILPSIFFVNNAMKNGYAINLIIAGVLGITAYVLFAFQFLLASRIKFIDKQFSLDKVYRVHMFLAIAAIILAYLHKTLESKFFPHSFQTTLGSYALDLFIAIIAFSIMMMVNKLLFKISIVDYIRKLLNDIFKIKYQYKLLIHNITIIALIILMLHIILANSVTSNLPLQITLEAYFIIPITMYFYHKIVKVYFDDEKKYIVSEVIKESNNIVTLKFKKKKGKAFIYYPGQFLYVRLCSKGVPHDEHPFTISSTPTERNYISVTVKQLGDFTNKLNLVKPFDKAYIDGPFGNFTFFNKAKNKKLCFIAGGIGITPFLSMLRFMRDKKLSRDTLLLWGVRDLSELICKDEIDGICSSLKRVSYIPVVSNDNRYRGEKGFIDAKLIKKYIDNVLQYDFYICGPPIMMEIQIKNLTQLGVPKENIHFERFSI